MAKEIIAKEVAEQEFERFCESNRIDTCFDDFSEEDIKVFNEHRRRIVKAIMAGTFAVNESGAIIADFEGNKLTFKTPKGAAFLAMDVAKKGQDMKAQFEVMAAISGVHAAVFSKMEAPDVKDCLAVTALFLAS